MQVTFGRVRRRIAQLQTSFLLITGVHLEMVSDRNFVDLNAIIIYGYGGSKVHRNTTRL